VLTPLDAGQVSAPERASEQLKLTVTALLFQPATLGEGETVAVITGWVLSMFTVWLSVALFPAPSLQAADIV